GESYKGGSYKGGSYKDGSYKGGSYKGGSQKGGSQKGGSYKGGSYKGVVLMGGPNAELERLLKGAGLQPTLISFTRFDDEAAAKVHHFETYNRTPASQRVADIVSAVRAHPDAPVLAEG